MVLCRWWTIRGEGCRELQGVFWREFRFVNPTPPFPEEIPGLTEVC